MKNKIQFGSHLAVVRNWMQWNAGNGSTVTWGSDEFLRLKPLTVSDMENLAQQIKEAVEKEIKEDLIARFKSL